MRSKTVDRLIKTMPKDVEIFVDWYSDLVVLINQLMHENQLNKKEFAKRLEKSPSEISKWLSGEHNFTLHLLAKISAELGTPLFEVSKKKNQVEFLENIIKTNNHVFVSYKKPENTSKLSWQKAKKLKSQINLPYAG